MSDGNKGLVLKALAVISFLVMVTINGLANALPINGIDSGSVSDAFPNLFAPAGFTFSIWGLIYFLLAGFTLYQGGVFQANSSMIRADAFNKIRIYFIISSFANALWIFSWHYFLIGLSLILMIVILVSLILIALAMKETELSHRDRIFIKIPFSVYFGWITVASIAKVTIFLVSIGWHGLGISEDIWTAVILVVGLVISTMTLLNFKMTPYIMVTLWAYGGILAKHLSESGFDRAYPIVIFVAAASIVFLIGLILYMISKQRNKPMMV